MVTTGLDVLFREHNNLLSGKRIGLVANPSSINSDFRFIVDLFHEEKSWKLGSLFGPEHGLRGEMQAEEWCEPYKDPLTGLRVFSLYGQKLKPERSMLDGIDTVVFDMQDVGSRYYTFVYTLSYIMEACGAENISVVVLDRPNPIGGVDIEGPMLEPGYESFVGRFPLPIRHGMTIGELAQYFTGECGIKCDLKIVPMTNWDRSSYFEETGLPWVLPSPNMPTVDTAVVYPGMCLLEGTTLSEGRGTTRPFEIFGAPWIDPYRLCKSMEGSALAGAQLRPLYFRPTFSKHQEQLCGGAQIHVTDRKTFRPVRFAISLFHILLRDYPYNFQWKEPPYEFVTDRMPIDILFGNRWIRDELEKGTPPETIEQRWTGSLNKFIQTREKYLMYST